MPIEKNCLKCNKIIYATPSNYKTKNYCSVACMHPKELITKNCPRCGTEFTYNPKVTKGAYCRPKCVATDDFYKKFIGQKIGSFTIKEFSHKRGRRTWFLAECECGITKILRSDYILSKSKNKRRCDNCYKLRGCPDKYKDHYRTYTVWKGMHQRCYSPTSFNYYLYGERGIKVADRWHKFENFLEDMGDRPGDNYHIDRIDPDGDYEPSNCRWVTASENQKNRRNIHKNGYIFIKKDKLCKECLINNKIKME